jgi:hypothetical protein
MINNVSNIDFAQESIKGLFQKLGLNQLTDQNAQRHRFTTQLCQNTLQYQQHMSIIEAE